MASSKNTKLIRFLEGIFIFVISLIYVLYKTVIMSNISHTRDLFLYWMSVVYLVAFASLYVQIPGLYGDKGILPAKLVMSKEPDSWEELLDDKPTLLKLTAKLSLTTEQGMDFLCIVGMAISFMCVLCKTGRDMMSFILLWMLYLSLYQVGQTFLSFQWDILLLEVGFLTILVAPFNLQIPTKMLKTSFYHCHDNITMWLVRWLLFRLMFASGVVKLDSKCPTWWGLTALTWHFESQCIPTPLAWYWHHLPVWFLKLSVVAMYVIQIPTPFLFFSPIRSMRIFSFWAQIMLQGLIIITGNYNFFNLLTVVLCITLLDDTFLGQTSPKKKTSNITHMIANALVYGYMWYQTIRLFSLNVADDFTIESKVAFTHKDLHKFLEVVVPWTIWFGAFSLGFEVIVSLVRCYTEVKGVIWKNWAAIQCLAFGLIAAAMFGMSLVPYTSIEPKLNRKLPSVLNQWHSKMRPFQLSSSYGLFRSMTGVGGRPEVVLEGSDSLDGDWREYEFLYKPGDVNRRPPVVAPHQPRLDWQMWFAALGSYQHNPWFLNLAYRLLTNQPEVIDLVQYNPFPEKPPKYVRAKLYTYHYTNSSESDSDPSAWWRREETREYLPAISADDSSLINYLKHNGIIEAKKKKKKKASSSYLRYFLVWVRGIVGQPEGFVFIMSLLITAFTLQFITYTVMS